jgi:hypothetical protein
VSIQSKVAATRTVGPKRGFGRRVAMALITSVALGLTPASALAEPDGIDMMKEAGVGMGTAVASLVYAPLKLTYAFGGMVVGGLAWAFSGGDANVTSIVLTPSLRGDYVISRQQLLGQQELMFFGRPTSEGGRAGWEDVSGEEEVASASPHRW